MRKNRKRLYAILMTLVIAITALPTIEAKAAEDLAFNGLTFGETMKVGASSSFTVDINSTSRYNSVDIYLINKDSEKINISVVYDAYNHCECILTIPVDATLGKYMFVLEGTNSEGNVTTFRDDSWYIYVADSGGNIYSNVMFVFENQTGLEPMTITKDKITSPKITIRELLGENCTPEDTELGAFLGWKYNDNLISVDKEFEVTSDEEIFYFYPIFEKKRVNLAIEYIDKDGNLKWDEIQGLIVDNDTTNRELLPYLPSETELYSSFTEWMMPSGSQLDDVIGSYGVHFRAVYSTYAVTITQTYIAEDGSVKTAEIKKEYPAGTTVQDIIDDLPSQSDMSSTYTINGWATNTGVQLDDLIDDIGNEIVFLAQYTDKKIVQYSYSYIESNGEYGLAKYIDSYIQVNKQDTLDAASLEQYVRENYFSKLSVTHLENAGFDSWYVWTHDFEEDGSYDAIIFEALYTKPQLHLWYNEDNVYVYVIEPGQIVQLPTVVNGRKATWINLMDGKTYDETYTVPSDITQGDMIPFELVLGETVQEATTNSNVSPTGDSTNSNVPPTGDSTNIIPYLMLIMVGIGVILVSRKKRFIK